VSGRLLGVVFDVVLTVVLGQLVDVARGRGVGQRRRAVRSSTRWL
jgi:hypothetical protein